MKSWIRAAGLASLLAGSIALAPFPAAAQTVMQQCGQQYQVAKTAGTLNGQTWNQYRTECAARLKAQPASAISTDAPAVAANPLKPAPAVAVAPAPAPTVAAAPAPAAESAVPASTAAAPAGKQLSPGRVAFMARQRQCGTEWKANKATLTAQTPGLTWPKYLSQCNTRLKAAGQ